MAKTTKILGPGLPQGGLELLLSDPSPGQMRDMLTAAATAVPLVDGGVFVFHGGLGSPFSILQTEVQEPQPAKVTIPRSVRG